MADDELNRRDFLTRGIVAGGGLVAAAGVAYAGYEWPHSHPLEKPEAPEHLPAATPAAEPATPIVGVSSFVSRPDLTPPLLSLAHRPSSSHGSGTPRYFFVSPKGYQTPGPGQAGLMIFDRDGHLVWFLPRDSKSTEPFDLQVQTYKGAPVLTWWQGTVTDGYGQGTGYLFDGSYSQIATIKAVNGLHADLHELNLTTAGTALVTTYRTATTDLSAIGGSPAGQVLACQVQEIDVATGELKFSWDSLDHVPVTESQVALPKGKQTEPLDYFHMNSIAVASDGDLLISARNTWTVYKVARPGGEIVWRLNGKKSDFAMGEGAQFYWQHHVRPQSGTRISIFDDGASPPEEARSRGILLDVDTNSMRAELVSAFEHPARLLAANQGSVQYLSDGKVVVGWGDQPYCSEFDADGTMALDVRFPDNMESYRAFSYGWVAAPAGTPVVAVKPSATGGTNLHVSWNGATEVDSWQVLAGKAAEDMATVATAYRTGFETAITVNDGGPYFAVTAKDVNGESLGRSATVHSA